MNYDTPSSRFGVVGVDVIPRGDVIYMDEQAPDLASAEQYLFSDVSVETESHEELARIIRTIAAKDVRTMSIPALLQPEAAFQRAMDVYDVYASDTSLRPEVAVAEYFHAFTEAVTDPERLDVAPQDVEALLSGIATLLAAADGVNERLSA